MKVREIPQFVIDFITKEEGCILHAYKDISGYPTIGIGHLIRKGEIFSEVITKEFAQDLLRKDILSSAASIMRLVTVPLLDQQYSALISFTFNVGSGALQCSTLRSMLNREEYYDAADEFPRWCWSKGKKLQSLRHRRLRERKLFLS